MFKRFLSMVLVLVTLVSVLPPRAEAELADETVEVAEEVTEETAEETVEEETEAEVTEVTAAETEPEETAEETGPAEVVPEESESAEDGQETFEADGVVASGACGENLIWSIDGKKTLTISGTGPMYNYCRNSSIGEYGRTGAPWQAYSPKKLVVEKGVTSIGDEAFSGLDSLGELSLPEGIESIGDYAFMACRGIYGTLNLPQSLKSIGGGAFAECGGLTGKLELPEGLTTLGGAAFFDCSGFTGSLVLPRSIKVIEHNTFINCNGFSGMLILPEELTNIGELAFCGCSGLNSVVIPVGLREIKSDCFGGCNSIRDVYYGGSQGEWSRIAIEVGNDSLLRATIHYGWNNVALELISTQPGNGASNVALETPLVLTFSEDISEKLDWTKGKIFIRNYETDDLAIAIDEEAFEASGGKIDGNQLILPVNFHSDRFCASYSGKFYLLADPGVISSVDDKQWDGIAKKDVLAFTLKRNISNSGFSFGKDTFKFNNASGYFGDYFNFKLLPLHEYRLMRKLNPMQKMIVYSAYIANNATLAFKGNCFGMSALMGLLNTGSLSLEGIQNGAHCTFDVDYPKSNENVRSYLSYYQLLQYVLMPRHWDKSDERTECRKLATHLSRRISPVLLSVGVGTEKGYGDHEVLAYAIDAEIDPKNYVVFIADPNSLMRAPTVDGNLVDNPHFLPIYYALFISKEDYSYNGIIQPWSGLGLNKSYITSVKYALTDLSVFDKYSIENDESYLSRNLKSILGTQCENFSFINAKTGEKVVVRNSEVVQGDSLDGPYSTAWGSDPSGMKYYNFDGSGNWRFLPYDEETQYTFVGFSQTQSAFLINSDAESIEFSQSGNVLFSGAKNESTVYMTASTPDEGIAVSVKANVTGLSLESGDAGRYTVGSKETLGDVTVSRIKGLDKVVEKRKHIQEENAVISTIDSEGVVIDAVPQTLELDNEYLILNVDDTGKQLHVLPETLNEDVTWYAENPDDLQVIAVDSVGFVKPINSGTAYVVAQLRKGNKILSARCRVDVTEQKPNEEVLGIDLTSPKVTTDLYSTDYTQIDILPRLPQNEVAAFAAAPEDNGAAITGAYLEDETARALFDLRVKDDRTLLVVPTQAAIEGAKGVKSSYSSKLAVSVNGVEYHTAEAVTIGVKKTLPKLKAGRLTFNPFYTGQSQALNITGGTVTKIEGTVPDWLELDGTKLTLKNAPKSGSASVNLLVYTEEWAVPVSVKVNVKLSYKAPAVKLSASSVSLSDSESKGTTLKLSAGKKTLEALGVESIRLPEGFEETVLDLSTGEFTLVPTGVIPTGKQTVRVYFYDTDAVLDLPLTVGKKSPVLKLSKSSVSLNGDLGDSVALKVTATPADLDLTKVVVTNPNEAVEVSPVNADGEFTVTVKAGTAPKANFPLTIQAPTGKAAKLTVKTLAAGQKVSMSLKAVGSIDLTYPEKGVDIQPIFKNYSGKLENIEYDLGDFLTLGEDDLLRWNGNIGLTTGTYPVTVTGNLPDGTVRSGTVKVKVIQTAVALKLCKTSLSLNKHLKESAQIAVTSGTKGYTLGTLGIRVTDSKNVPSDGLTAAYADGLLTLAVNDRTAYGSTYKVQLWATSNKISTVTVKIPAEKASAVTMTAKAKGQIDVIRDASQILVTPSYKNCLDGQSLGKQVNVTWAKDGKNYTQDVTGRFDLNWVDGMLQVSRMPGETLERTGKYRLEILCEGMEKPAYVNLPVKSGTAKVTAAPVCLYTKDANHRAELTFMSSDRTLNAVARVELKDAKLKASYEVLDLGDGQFALRLRPGAKAKNGTVTVNLFFEGNNGKKPNATASVKVEIR